MVVLAPSTGGGRFEGDLPNLRCSVAWLFVGGKEKEPSNL